MKGFLLLLSPTLTCEDGFFRRDKRGNEKRDENVTILRLVSLFSLFSGQSKLSGGQDFQVAFSTRTFHVRREKGSDDYATFPRGRTKERKKEPLNGIFSYFLLCDLEGDKTRERAGETSTKQSVFVF